MGFDWGISLKNNEKNANIDLISFCGWNSESMYNRIKECGEHIGEEDSERYKLNVKELLDWGKPLTKITDIFANISDRKIEYDLFGSKVSDKYADLCYELDIQFDSIIIFSLMRLNHFLEFLRSGDLFEYGDTKEAGWYLELWGSY